VRADSEVVASDFAVAMSGEGVLELRDWIDSAILPCILIGISFRLACGGMAS
jgi:hypothetical protein